MFPRMTVAIIPILQIVRNALDRDPTVNKGVTTTLRGNRPVAGSWNTASSGIVQKMTIPMTVNVLVSEGIGTAQTVECAKITNV